MAISAYGKMRECGRALELFEEMKTARIERNTITYSAAISACGKGGQWEQALRLIKDMKMAGIERDTITYIEAISACGKEGQWKEALRLLESQRLALGGLLGEVFLMGFVNEKDDDSEDSEAPQVD